MSDQTTKEFVTRRYVQVTVDPSKFDEAFMSGFRESFFQLFTLDEHLEHLAELYARGVIDGWPDEFIEGYGPAKNMGIKFVDLGSETEATDD